MLASVITNQPFSGQLHDTILALGAAFSIFSHVILEFTVDHAGTHIHKPTHTRLYRMLQEIQQSLDHDLRTPLGIGIDHRLPGKAGQVYDHFRLNSGHHC